MSAADADRLAQKDAAVYRVTRAAELLPWDTAGASRWLRARGLVRVVHVPDEEGEIRPVEVVVWGEVLAELEGRRAPPKPTTRRGSPRPATVPWMDPDER